MKETKTDKRKKMYAFNPSSKIGLCSIEFCMGASPMGYTHRLENVPYWKCYCRPGTYQDPRFGKYTTARSLKEIEHILQTSTHPLRLNAFPRQTTEQNTYTYIVIEERYIRCYDDRTDELLVTLDYYGRPQWINTGIPQRKLKAFMQTLHHRYFTRGDNGWQPLPLHILQQMTKENKNNDR